MPIRAAKESDKESITDLAKATEMFDKNELNDIISIIKDPCPTDLWFVDIDEGEGLSESMQLAVAYVTPEKMTNGTWNLLWIAVHPTAQGQGRGTAMLKHIEQVLVEKNQRMLLVETLDGDEYLPQRNFYEKFGFEREGKIRDFYDTGFDKVIFRKLLIKN